MILPSKPVNKDYYEYFYRKIINIKLNLILIQDGQFMVDELTYWINLDDILFSSNTFYTEKYIIIQVTKRILVTQINDNFYNISVIMRNIIRSFRFTNQIIEYYYFRIFLKLEFKKL